MDGIYLKAKEVVEKNEIDEKVSVTKMIALIEDVKTPKNEKSKVVICSKALKGIDANPEDFAKMCELYDEIEAERNAMAGVNVNDCTDEAEYKAKLAEGKKHLSADLWLAGALAHKEVDTFEDLKAVEPVEKI